MVQQAISALDWHGLRKLEERKCPSLPVSLIGLHCGTVLCLGPTVAGAIAQTGAARQALVARPGKIIPLVNSEDLESYCTLERHTCIDTTAAGGNASLLASVED